MLLTEPVAAGNAVAIGFWFSTGSRHEPENLCGMTHFTEHILFKGTRSRSSFEIASSFDRMGGYVNAYTERELVCLYCVVPFKYTEKALEILCDMVSDSTFEQKEIEKELQVIKSEIISAADDSEEAALDAVSQAVWPSQKISGSISGTVEDVEKITRKDLLSWYEKRFVHGKLTVSITGNFNVEKVRQILETLPEHDLKNGYSLQENCENLRPVWKSGINFVEAPFQQEQFFKVYPVPYPVDEKMFYTFAVLNALTGDAMSSRLFQQLREKGGYCYNVYSFFSYYEDAGLWCAYASSAKQESSRIVADIQKEIEKLKNNTITQDEVTSAIEHLCGEEMIASEDAEYRMKRLARNFLAGYSLASTEEIIAMLKKIELKDLNDAIKLLFDESKSALVVYGPKLSSSRKKKIEALL